MTRDEILIAAAQIFSQKGFHATSMADIAQAVSLQKGSLYHHISSKQELLVAMLDQALDLLIEQMQIVMARPLPAEQKLRQAMLAYLTTLNDHHDLAAVLLLEYRSLEPEYRSRHLPRRDRYERLWRDLIEQGLESGAFCCADPSMSARALLGVMNWTITWFRPDGPLSMEAVANQFSDLFLKGLLARPTQEPEAK